MGDDLTKEDVEKKPVDEIAELASKLGRLKASKGASFSIKDTRGILNDIGTESKYDETVSLKIQFYHRGVECGYPFLCWYHVKRPFIKIVMEAAAMEKVTCSPQETFVLWWDSINLEPHATPMGVGMVGGELIHAFKTLGDSGAAADRPDPLPTSLRISNDIDFGLNFLMADPLPIIYNAEILSHNDHPSPESALACKEQLKCLDNVLFPAFDLTINTFESSLPEHLPDFSKIKSKLRLNVYQHSVECMQEVYEQLARYENSAIVVSNAKCLEEGRRRLLLKKDLGRTLQEFQQAIQSYQGGAGFRDTGIGFDDYWKSNAFVDEKLKDKVIYVGPVRDFDEQTCISSPPTIALAGLTEATRVSHLLDSYNFHLDYKYMYTVTSVFCLDKCMLQSLCEPDSDPLVLDLIPARVRDADWTKFHFAFHLKESTVPQPMEDSRDIDALVDFIEGTNEAPGDGKKKKRKTKRRSKNTAVVATQEESEEGTRSGENPPEQIEDSVNKSEPLLNVASSLVKKAGIDSMSSSVTVSSVIVPSSDNFLAAREPMDALQLDGKNYNSRLEEGASEVVNTFPFQENFMNLPLMPVKLLPLSFLSNLSKPRFPLQSDEIKEQGRARALSRISQSTIEQASLEDSRGIDALVDFIEGINEAPGEGKKKRKTKRRSKNTAVVATQEESEDGTRSGENPLEQIEDSVNKSEPLLNVASSSVKKAGSDPMSSSVTVSSVTVPSSDNFLAARKLMDALQLDGKNSNSRLEQGASEVVNTSPARENFKAGVSAINLSLMPLPLIFDVSKPPFPLRSDEIKEPDGARALNRISQSAIEQASKEISQKQASLQQMQQDIANIEVGIESRESELGCTSTLLQPIIDNNHLELTAYQQRLEAEEDRMARNDKEAARIEGELARLREEVCRLEALQAGLAAENSEARKAAKKWRRKRIQLEEAVGRQLAPLREAKSQLGREIQEMRNQLVNKNQAILSLLHTGTGLLAVLCGKI